MLNLSAMTQMLLFPDPRPLVDRLGTDFFRVAPHSPGVYLMRDAAGTVLYVGKAKNLRNRLGAYRIANPDRMPQRHLRMLRAVARIELQPCADEASATTCESILLRMLKPKFNRAGVWPATPRFLTWRLLGEELQLGVSENPQPEWTVFGPLGSIASVLRAVLVRLLWCALHPALNPSQMPLGWLHGRCQPITVIPTGLNGREALDSLQKLISAQPAALIQWLRTKIPAQEHPVDLGLIEADLEFLSDYFELHGNATW